MRGFDSCPASSIGLTKPFSIVTNDTSQQESNPGLHLAGG